MKKFFALTLTLAFLLACFSVFAEKPRGKEAEKTELIWDFESEDEFNAWTCLDSDGDGHNWYWVHDADDAEWWMHYYSGAGAACSASFVNDPSGWGGTTLTPDNWLISPEFIAGSYISFQMIAGEPDDYYGDDPIGVYIICNGQTSSQLGLFTTSWRYEEHVIDLSAYTGRTVQLALRHYGTNGEGFNVLIDYVKSDGTLSSPPSANGDVDGDGTVSVMDALLAMRHAIGLLQLTSEQLPAADMDEDGTVSVTDALTIMRLALSIN